MVLAAGARDHVENHFLFMALNRAIRWRGVLGVAVLAAGLAPVALAQGKGGKVREELLQKDFPFQGACINANFPGDNVAMKGLAIRVGNDAAMLFDTDLLRFAAGWTGGFIDTRGVVFDGGHGNHPAIVGEQRFGAAVVPGVAGPDGIFKDTRSEPYGPISQKLARWDGMAVDGMAVQLDYTVLGTRVHEQPSSVASGGDVAFVRVIQVDPPQGWRLAQAPAHPGDVLAAAGHGEGRDHQRGPDEGGRVRHVEGRGRR